jgi:transcriptional regulator with XRE-family HTH domain
VDISERVAVDAPSISSMSHIDSNEIRARIRQLRRERGLTLLAFEKLSGGRIRAVVLGAYERGDREMSLKKVIEIAEVFEVELAHLTAPSSAHRDEPGLNSRHIYDLRALQALETSVQREVLAKYIARIAHQRGDWAGEIISLRRDDIDALSRVIDGEEINFRDWVVASGILLTKR